jgi:hypothetical protein
MDENLFTLFERTWAAALQRGDAEMLETLLDREFSAMSWSSRGEILTRNEYIEAARTAPLNCCAVEAFCFRQVGKVVIARGILKCDCITDDVPWICEFLVTDVWMEGMEGWKVVSRHSSAQFDSLMKSNLAKVRNTVESSVGQLL